MAFSMWRERRDVYRVLVGNPEGKNHLEDYNGRIRLKWIFRKWGGVAWTGLTWLRGSGGRHLKMR
jgi:hypothetical protein